MHILFYSLRGELNFLLQQTFLPSFRTRKSSAMSFGLNRRLFRFDSIESQLYHRVIVFWARVSTKKRMFDTLSETFTSVLLEI